MINLFNGKKQQQLNWQENIFSVEEENFHNYIPPREKKSSSATFYPRSIIKEIYHTH